MRELRRGTFFIINTSKRCEPSAYLFTKAVRFFFDNGYEMAKSIADSDVILVNTCCVTKDKQDASKTAIDLAIAHGQGKKVILFGCMAGLDAMEFDRENLISINPKSLGKLDDCFPHRTSVNSISVGQLSPFYYSPGQGLDYEDYFIMIAQGCTNHCSYCNIKRVKGDVKSETVETILGQLQKGVSMGRGHFVLLADDCASYGQDVGRDLVYLLREMLAFEAGFTLKLGYLYPQFLLTHLNQLCEIFATDRIRYANIPIQSGSQRILDLMNRRYDIKAVAEAVGRVRATSPGMTLCTHIMINFPTESDDDFLKSLEAADIFDEVIFLHYSDNQGTAAASLLPKITESEARKRLVMASEYANRRKPGSSVVIKDFNDGTPYNYMVVGQR